MAEKQTGMSLRDGLSRLMNSPRKERKRKKPRIARNWSKTETFQLLKLVGDREIQALLKNMVHNRFIWEGIAAKMNSNRNAEQCHDRWLYLKRRYRAVAQRQTDRSDGCYYFDEMKRILGKKLSNGPDFVRS